jgi:hypothetical protein
LIDDPADTLSVAWAAGLPVLAARDLAHADTLTTLAEFQADVACVACFTRRIPPAVLNRPRLGFLNIHPSLLPAYRGPEPVFWQLHQERRPPASPSITWMKAWTRATLPPRRPSGYPMASPNRPPNNC